MPSNQSQTLRRGIWFETSLNRLVTWLVLTLNYLVSLRSQGWETFEFALHFGYDYYWIPSKQLFIQ